MAILIKGMKMPKVCHECGFYHRRYDFEYSDDEYCGANHQVFNDGYDNTKPHINPFKEKLNTCPLVEVPEPHGRLIDAGALKNKWTHKDLDLWSQGWPWLHDLNQAPTIIQASEEAE